MKGSAVRLYAPHTGSARPSILGIAASQRRAALTAIWATSCVTYGMSHATAKITSLRAPASPASRPASGPADGRRSKTTRYGTGSSSCSGSAKENITSEYERATGRPRVPNELVAQACRDHPQNFVGFGSVDPLKGAGAVAELDGIAELGLKGIKLHPSLQAFAPDDERHWPLYARCEELGLIALFHTGTSGIGGGQPGGQGIRLDYARPIRLDAAAASFPDLQIIAAHFGYPWHLELLAMALHKTNIHIDISGWAPRYIPAEVLRDMKGRLQDQFLFGSDYPFIQPKPCLEELSGLDLPDPVLQKVLLGNGDRLLGWSQRAKAPPAIFSTPVIASS